MPKKKPKKSMFSGLDEGAFTEKAKRAGMSVQQYAHHVLKEGSKASAHTKKQAQFAINAKKIARKRKSK